MTIWLDEKESRAFELIIESDLCDIVSLVADAGYDPRTFFVAGIADGLDFRGSDITGISFRMTSLNEAIFYKDQFETVKQTNPRSFKKVRLFDRPASDDRSTGTSELPYQATGLQLDERRPSRETFLSRFKNEIDSLDYIQGYTKEYSEEEKSMLTELVLSMPDLETRLYALRVDVGGPFLEKEIMDQLSSDAGLNELANISNQNKELSRDADNLYLQISRNLSKNFDILKKYMVQNDSKPYLLISYFAKHINNEGELLYIKRLYRDISCFIFLKIVFASSYFKSGKILDVNYIACILKKCDLYDGLGASELELIVPHVRLSLLQQFVDLCRDRGFEPSCSAFVSCARYLSLEDAPKLASFMRREGVRCEKEVSDIFVSCCQNLDEINRILNLFHCQIYNIAADKLNKIFPNITESVKYGSGFDEFEPFFQFCRDHKIKLNESLMYTISNTCVNIDHVKQFLNLTRSAGIKIDVIMFVNFTRSWNDASSIPALLKLAHQEGVITSGLKETSFNSSGLYGRLISKAETLAEKREIFDEMENFILEHDLEHEAYIKIAYLYIMNATDGFNNKVAVFNEMKVKSIQPHIQNFIALSESVENIEEAVAVIDLIEDFDVSPSNLIFENFSKAASSKKDLEVLLELMKRHDISLNKSMRQNLIAAIQDVAEQSEVEFLLERYS